MLLLRFPGLSLAVFEQQLLVVLRYRHRKPNTPKFIIVLRFIPVILSIERILEPSAKAAITAIFFSVFSTFAMY